jgi:hypothetical protein
MPFVSAARLSMVVLLAAIASGQPTAACEDTPLPKTNRSTVTGADCSFSAAGPHDFLSGFPTRDIGNGKVAFRLTDDRTCGPLEELVFVDCNSGQSIAVRGEMDPETVARLKRTGAVLLGVDERIKFIQPPFGDIALTGASTVESIREASDRSGYVARTDLREWIASFKRRDRFDLFCGCKLYYPESVGA